MTTTDDITDVITIHADLTDDALDALAVAFDEAGANAVIGPVPGRMGTATELVIGFVSGTASTVIGTMVQAAGGRAWAAFVNAVRSRRETTTATGDEHNPAVILQLDRVRVELTLADLADSRVSAGLLLLRDIAGPAGLGTLRWDRTTGKWSAIGSGDTSGHDADGA